VIGKHRGLSFYTIGQREGVGASGEIPYYVVRKEAKTNTLIVAPLGDPSHFQPQLEANGLTWVGKKPKVPDVQVRIRYRQPLVEAKITDLEADKLVLEFKEPQRAVTPGQAVVLYNSKKYMSSYQNDEVLGGGTISEEKLVLQKTQIGDTQGYIFT